MRLVIFGCGKIANRIAKSCKLVDGLDLVGFASRDINKAKEYCETYNCKEYGNYDYFLNSDVDAVYITTYNKSHYSLIKEAILHNKNVICEKPMLSSIEKNKELFALARKHNVLLMEALKSVFLPIIIKTKQIINDKKLGNVISISAGFMRNGSHDDNHWINDPDCGGALLDLGSYCIGTMNYLLDKKPVLKEIETNKTATKADSTSIVTVDYDGIKGKCSVSNRLDGDNSLYIEFEKGYLKIENYWKNNNGYYVLNDKRYELNEELISDFYYELKHFNDLVDKGIKESNVMNEQASENILIITGVNQNDYSK